MNLNDLNPQQREAASTLEGPVLVLAGAGSGKTKMLTYRVANLIEHGVKPWHIMAITFTNKAAREMRERVVKLVGEDGNDVWVSTFHAACSKILRRDIEKLGYNRNFVIYDDADQKSALRRILTELNLDEKVYSLASVKSIISHAKEKLLSPTEWKLTAPPDYRNETYYDIYVRYEKQLKENNALDFNDLIIRTLELFTQHPPVLQYYQNLVQYLHVDEYQDTDMAQYNLVSLLVQDDHNLCVVGDDDQSIYSWRGADISNILNFEKDYPEAKVVKLERNYRSSANILDAANQVIAENSNRMEKALWTEREAGDKIVYRICRNEIAEAEWVGDKIRELHGQGASYSDFAILYRMNSQSRNLDIALSTRGIPYKEYGGLRFFDRKEVKDALAYVRLVVNPTDDVSFQRVINVPKRGLGEVSINALMDYAASEGIPALSACMSLPDDFNKRIKNKVEGFGQLLMRLTLEMEQRTPSDFVKYLIEETGMLKELDETSSEDNMQRKANLFELVNAVKEYEEANPESTLFDFLQSTSLESSFDQIDETEGTVMLMTMHGAKGLEFPTVFMVGMDEGVFPSYRAIKEEDEDPQKMEEERRLCYVGITRAENRLFLSHTEQRMVYGDKKPYESSRFIDSIPERLIEMDESVNSFGGYKAPEKKPTLFETEESLFDGGNLWKTRSSQGSMGRAAGFGSGNQVKVGGVTIPGVYKGFGTQMSTSGGFTGGAGIGQSGISKATEQRRVSSVADTGFGTTTYQVGDRVMHKKFGMGTVAEIRPGNGADDRTLVVRFGNGETKALKERLAPIVRMED